MKTQIKFLSVCMAATLSFAAQATPADKLSQTISSHELQHALHAVSNDLSSVDMMCSDRFDHPSEKHEWSAWFNQVQNGEIDPVLSSSSRSDRAKQVQGNLRRGVATSAGAPQVVVLDFEVGEPTFQVTGAFGGAFDGILFDDYVYTQEDKDEIQRRIEADFAGFNFVFTQEVPEEGDFVLLQFNSNDNPGETAGILPNGGILFGRADEIDFGNDNFATAAIIDANIWQFLYQIDPTGGVLSGNSGIVIDENTTPEDALRIAIINQSANTGAHELGHTLGLRHYDAFGAIGEGLPATGSPTPDSFFPAYTGRQAAVETTLHTMASGASSGITLRDSANSDRFFSERSIVKLGFNDRQRDTVRRSPILQEDELNRFGYLRFNRLSVPNNIREGLNAGQRLDVRNIVLEGSIDELEEVDRYRVFLRAGSIFNAEVISTVDINDDTVFPRIRLYREDRRDKTLTLVAENDDEFESFDSFLLDAEINSTGVYVIEIDAPDTVQTDIDGDGIDDTVDFSLFGEETELALRRGKYTLNAYQVTGR